MNRSLKGIVLFIALLFPVLIFLFLKIFGQNEFDIPVYYQSEVIGNLPCDDVAIPYSISQSLVNKDNKNTSYHHIYQVLDIVDDNQLRHLMRVKDRLGGEKVTINSFIAINSLIDIGIIENKYQVNGNWRVTLLVEDSIRKIRDCELLAVRDSSLVLIDSARRIRGYYDGTNPKDVDRLILETKILIYGNKNE